jgi:3-dehydroquinate synthase
MLEKGFTRTDCVVAVGGGVVGDLAGFCAASYMRGIDFYNIPTTLLSQVDSSVGGKTAVNLDGIKNIVGAFYQPKKVLIDPDVLSTLDKRQFSNGLAEAIKTAVCFDEKMFDMFENCNINDNIEKIIEMSIKIKSGVVESDEKESGLRRALNFGHTIGHGIEAQGGLYHGECVALGMLAMCSPQVRTRLEKVLKKAGLPIKYEYDKAKILEAVSHDKKMAGETLNTVYVDKVGSYQFRTVTFEEFKNIFKENF